MKKQTLMHGSIIAVLIIAAAVGVGMVTGFSGIHPFATSDLVSDSETGDQPGTAVNTPEEPKQYIRIDPVTDKTTGDLLIISGTTSLPAGTTLMVSTGNYGGNTQVRAGTGGVNLFSSPVDTTAMKPGTRTITVNNMVGDPARGDYGPGSVRTTTSFFLNGPYLTTDSPVEATVRNGDYLHLNPVGNRSTRDQFVISGTTSLPVGTEVFWQIIPYTGTPPAGINKSSTGIMANGQVTKGDGTANRVSLAVDMNGFSPGKWVAQAGDLKGEPGSGNFEMGVVTGTAYFTLTQG